MIIILLRKVSKRRDVAIVDLIIPTNLVRVLFGPAIPTSSFNFQFFFILVSVPFLLLTGQLMICTLFQQLYHLA